MTTKRIEIGADIKVNTAQTEAAFKKLNKAFKDAFAQTNADKMFNEMKKINPLINQIDASLGKMMKSMVKDNARKEFKLMNQALSEQTKIIDANIKKYKDLTDQIENASEAQKKALEHERQMAIKNTREAMGRSQQYGQRRDEAKQTLGGVSAFDMLKIAALSATAGRVGSSIANFAGGFESRKLGYEAQRDSLTNTLLSGFTSGGLDLGILASSGKLGRGINAADREFKGMAAGKVISGIGDVVAGGAAGMAVGGPAGALTGALGGLGMNIGSNADLLAMPEARQAALAEMNQRNMESGLASTSYVRELAAERMGKARGRIGAMEAVGTRRIGQGLRAGRRLGFGEGEILSAMGMVGQSGLLGQERLDIGTALKMQRQGIATVEQTGGLLSGAMTGLSKQTTVMEQLKKAMMEGTKKGVETSLVKDLVGATIQIANQGNARAQDLDTFQRLMETALGGKKAAEVGRADIAAAQTAVATEMSMRGGGNNPVLQAIRMIGVKSLISKAGIDINQMSPSDVFALSKASTTGQITEGQRAILEKAGGGGEEGKRRLEEFLSGFDEQAELDVTRAEKPGSGRFGALSTKEGLAAFRKKIAAGGQEAMVAKAQLANEYVVSRGLTQDQADRMADLKSGQILQGKGTVEDVSAKSWDRAFAAINSFGESVHDSVISQKEVAKVINDGMKATYEVGKQLTDPNNPNFKPLLQIANNEANLNVSMQELTRAIVANTQAIKGEKTDAGTVEKVVDNIKKVVLGGGMERQMADEMAKNIAVNPLKKTTGAYADFNQQIKQITPTQGARGATPSKPASKTGKKDDTVFIDWSKF